MQTVKVPIINGEYTNVDGVVLTDKSFSLYDSYVDEEGATNKRPALTTKLDLSQPSYQGIRALKHWRAQDKLYGVWPSAFTIQTRSGDTLSLSSTITSVGGLPFNVTTPRSYIVDDGTYLYFSTGTKIVKYDQSAGTLAFLDTADAQAPVTASHIAYTDGYLLANALNSNRFYFSEVNDPSTWSALDFASASADPDYILALHVFRRELYLFGAETTEIWENDGTSPWIRTPGGLLETGIAAPHSVVNNDDGIFWISSRRRIVKCNGQSVEVISTPYDKLLGRMDVTDATADRLVSNGQEFLLFHFPTGPFTLAWNVTTNTWAKWGRYDSNGVSYGRFRGVRHIDIPTWNMRLCGSIEQAKIFSVNETAYIDDSDEIRPYRLTGHINYGTTKDKISRELRITVRRGDAGVSVTTAPKLLIRWKDNNRRWSNQKELSLGLVGETDILLKLRQNGIFATRQYEISSTENVPIVYVDAEEDIEVLR